MTDCAVMAPRRRHHPSRSVSDTTLVPPDTTDGWGSRAARGGGAGERGRGGREDGESQGSRRSCVGDDASWESEEGFDDSTADVSALRDHPPPPLADDDGSGRHNDSTKGGLPGEAAGDQTPYFTPDETRAVQPGRPSQQRRMKQSHHHSRPGNKGRPVKTCLGSAAAAGRSIIQCGVCGKTFNNSSALAKHKLIHSDERKYSCSICSKAFKRQDHLNGHMMTHYSKKPYECRYRGCDKSYCDARSLRRHLENHHQQQLLLHDQASSCAGSVCSDVLTPRLTPGLTPGGLTPGLTPDGRGRNSNVFSFDVSAYGQFGDVGGVFGELGGGGGVEDMSPVSPGGGGGAGGQRETWPSGYNPLDEPKPVQCTMCDKRFRNLPALNGHMRLHGGYMKKEFATTTASEAEIKMADDDIIKDQSLNAQAASGPSWLVREPPDYSTLRLKREIGVSDSATFDGGQPPVVTDTDPTVAITMVARKHRGLDHPRRAVDPSSVVATEGLTRNGEWEGNIADRTRHLRLSDDPDALSVSDFMDLDSNRNARNEGNDDWAIEKKPGLELNDLTNCFVGGVTSSEGGATKEGVKLRNVEVKERDRFSDRTVAMGGGFENMCRAGSSQQLELLSPVLQQQQDSQQHMQQQQSQQQLQQPLSASHEQPLFSRRRRATQHDAVTPDVVDAVHVNLFNGGNVRVNPTPTSRRAAARLPFYGNAALHSPGLAASAPATPAGFGFSRVGAKPPKSVNRAPMYSPVCDERTRGDNCEGGGGGGRLPPYSPFLAAPVKWEAEPGSNVFQFPPSRATPSLGADPGTPGYCQSPFTPRHPPPPPRTPYTPGGGPAAGRAPPLRFQFPPVSSGGCLIEELSCESPFQLPCRSQQQQQQRGSKYHPYAPQSLASPHCYAQQQLGSPLCYANQQQHLQQLQQQTLVSLHGCSSEEAMISPRRYESMASPLASPHYHVGQQLQQAQQQQELQQQQLQQERQQLQQQELEKRSRGEKLQRDMQQVDLVLEQHIQQFRDQEQQPQQQQLDKQHTSQQQQPIATSRIYRHGLPQTVTRPHPLSSALPQTQEARFFLEERTFSSTSSDLVAELSSLVDSGQETVDDTLQMYLCAEAGNLDDVSVELDLVFSSSSASVPTYASIIGEESSTDRRLALNNNHVGESQNVEFDLDASPKEFGLPVSSESFGFVAGSGGDLGALTMRASGVGGSASDEFNLADFGLVANPPAYAAAPCHEANPLGTNLPGTNPPGHKTRRKQRPEPLVIPSSVNNYGYSGRQGAVDAEWLGGRASPPPPYSSLDRVDPAGGEFWVGGGNNGGRVYRAPPQSAPAYRTSSSTTKFDAWSSTGQDSGAIRKLRLQ